MFLLAGATFTGTPLAMFLDDRQGTRYEWHFPLPNGGNCIASSMQTVVASLEFHWEGRMNSGYGIDRSDDRDCEAHP
jgi:hypothetical protein